MKNALKPNENFWNRRQAAVVRNLVERLDEELRRRYPNPTERNRELLKRIDLTSCDLNEIFAEKPAATPVYHDATKSDYAVGMNYAELRPYVRFPLTLEKEIRPDGVERRVVRAETPERTILFTEADAPELSNEKITNVILIPVDVTETYAAKIREKLERFDESFSSAVALVALPTCDVLYVRAI